MTDKAVGVVYDGPAGVARDSQWLTAEDMPFGPAKVVVADVMRYKDIKFKGGNGPDKTYGDYLSLRFKSPDGKSIRPRELGLNATNRRIMVAMFGARTGNWAGKEITLYVTQVSAFGKMVDCVRIRQTKSVAATAAEDFIADAASNSAAEPEPVVTNGKVEPTDKPADRPEAMYETEDKAREAIIRDITHTGVTNPTEAAAELETRVEAWRASRNLGGL